MMPEVAGEYPTGAKVGTEEAGVVPVAEGAGAPGGRGWLRRGWAVSDAGGVVAPGACQEAAGGAEEARQNQCRSAVGRVGRQFWCR